MTLQLFAQYTHCISRINGPYRCPAPRRLDNHCETEECGSHNTRQGEHVTVRKLSHPQILPRMHGLLQTVKVTAYSTLSRSPEDLLLEALWLRPLDWHGRHSEPM